jgi:hypothetical protein
MSARLLTACSMIATIGVALSGVLAAHVLDGGHRPDDERLRIRTGAYHATFSAAGMTFIPRVDEADEPRLTWRYRLRSLDRGSQRVAARPVRPVRAGADRPIVEFRRPGLIERYVGEPRGVEQLFILTDRPAGRGDLHVRGEIGFAGAAERVAGGMAFVGEAGRLTYDGIRAFDADGRDLPVRVETAGAGLDLVLDDAALERARFPVTIDPLIAGPLWVYLGTLRGHDIAYNPNGADYLTVFATPSAEDPGRHEIRVRRLDATGTPIGASSVISGSGSNTEPKVAFDRETNRYLVVWVRFIASEGALGYARVLDGSGAPVAAAFRFNDVEGSQVIYPAVAARNLRQHRPQEVSFAVVWRQSDGAGLHVRRKFVSAQGAELSEAQLSATTDVPFGQQAIAYDPHRDLFCVIWTQHDSLVTRSVKASTAALTIETTVAADRAWARDPALAFDPSSARYLAVWADDEDAKGGIFGQPLLSGSSPAPVGSRIKLDVSDINPSAAPAVAAQPGSFVVWWQNTSELFNEEEQEVQFRFILSYAYVVLPNTVHHGFEFIRSNYATDLAPALAVDRNGLTVMANYREAVQGAVISGLQRAVGTGLFRHAVQGRSGDLAGSAAADLVTFRPATGSWQVKSSAGTSSYSLGQVGDIPVLLDPVGNGQAQMGVFRPSTATWYMKPPGGATTTVVFGQGGDIPVPGDYVDDDRDDLAVFRPSNSTWYILSSATLAITEKAWGQPGDIPVPADYDGDGKIDLCVWRASSGQWLKIALDGSKMTSFTHGTAGDVPVQGNFVGNALADQVVYRPLQNVWVRRDGSNGAMTSAIWPVTYSTVPTDYPMPVDWDGDGKLNLALWDVTQGVWRIFDDDGGNAGAEVALGAVGDVPVGGPSRP